jgi:hypothetical protein
LLRKLLTSTAQLEALVSGSVGFFWSGEFGELVGYSLLSNEALVEGDNPLQKA